MDLEQIKIYLDLAQVIIVSLNKDGNVTFINKRGCEILGYESQEIIGKNWFDNFLPKSIVDKVKSVFEKIISGDLEPVEYFENPILTRDGKEPIIAWHNSFIKDSSGDIVEVISAGEDITEYRRAKTQIQEQLYTMNILYDLAQKLVSEDLNIIKRASIVTSICVEKFGASLAWIGQAEPDGKVKIISQYPEDHPYTNNLTVYWTDTPYGRGPTGRAIRNGKPRVINIDSEKNFAPWRERAQNFSFRVSAAFPLIRGKSSFGSFNLYSADENFFTSEKINLFQIIADLSASALENASLFEETQRRLKFIQALRNIDIAIAGSLDKRVIFRVTLDEVINQLGVDAIDILSFNPYTYVLGYMSGRGFYTNLIEKSQIDSTDDPAMQSVLEHRTLYIGDLNQSNNFTRKELVKEENFVSYYVSPIIAKGRVLGVVEIFNRSLFEEDDEWLNYLESLTSQIAIAIDNIELFQKLERSNIEIIKAYNATIEGWAYFLDLRDRETEGHSKRVADLTIKIAQKMGFKEEDLLYIRYGALLHDIGKMGIPDSILFKPDKLTEEEWEIMKKHPVYAYEILSRIEYLRPALDIPYYHHEKWDGTGYPKGLKGEEIPLPARIFAVVDVFDALMSDRPYRKAWTKEEAIKYIKEQSGKHFDPKVVDIFLSIVENNGEYYFQ